MNTIKNTNPVRKSIILLISFAIAFASMVTMACDENPCANGSACGIISPVTEIEQAIYNAVDENPCDNVSASC